MSTLKLDTLSNKAGTASVPSDTIVSGTAKAWVNFNGAGTVAIRRAFNVSSITDTGTGKYTINFSTPFEDTNYSMLASGSVASSNDITTVAIATASSLTPSAPTTSSFKIFVYRSGLADVDSPYICIGVFR